MKTWSGFILFLLLFVPDAVAGSIGATANLEPRTSGSGLSVSIPLTDNLNARLGFNHQVTQNNLTLPGTLDTNDSMTVNVKRKADNYDVLLDWFPFNNYFRVTTGVIFRNMTTTMLVRKSSSTIHELSSTESGALVSTIHSPTRMVPYLGFGLGLPHGRSYRRGLALDIGILFDRPPSLALDQSRCTASGVRCRQLSEATLNQKQHIAAFFEQRRYFMARAGLVYRF